MAIRYKAIRRMVARRWCRLLAAAALIAMSGVVAGCSSNSTDFDPSSLLDGFDTKKKLPGNREPVFPGGVPGLEQGVPRDLYKENVDRQQLLGQETAPVETAPPPAAEAPKPRASSRSRAAQPVPPAGADAAATPPAPKPARTVRRRSTTVPPPDPETPAAAPQAQPQAAPPAASSSPFPAPLPSGSFQR